MAHISLLHGSLILVEKERRHNQDHSESSACIFQPPNHHKDLVDKGKAIDFIFSFQRSPLSGASYVKILVFEVKSFSLFQHITKWQDTDPPFTCLLI